MELTYKDRKDLKCAKNILENPGLAAKVMNYIGIPIAQGVEMLPKDWSVAVSMVTKQSLEKALLLSLSTLGSQTKRTPGISCIRWWSQHLGLQEVH